MKSTLRAGSLAFMALLLILFSCNDDTPSPQEQVKVERSLFGCTDYEIDTLVDPSEFLAFDEMAEFGDYFIYGGFDDILISKGFNGTEEVKERSVLWANELLAYNGKMLIGSSSGLFEFDEALNFSWKIDQGCWGLIQAPDGKLLFAPGDGGILEVNPTDYSLQPYNSPYDRGMCITLSKLHFSPDGKLWAIDCDNNLLQFDEPDFVLRENAESSEFWGHDGQSPTEDGIHFLNYGNAMLVVTKAGTSFYEILHYEDGEWTSLFLIDVFDSSKLSEKGLEMMRSSIQDAVLDGNRLLLSTNRGVHEFALSGGQEVDLESASIIVDPNLPSESVNKLYLSTQGDWYAIVAQRYAVCLGCN